MRILVVAQYYPPDMGGGATRAHNAVQGLLRAGCSVVVLTAFPHYPTGRIPDSYRGKFIETRRENGAAVVRVWMPRLVSEGLLNRLILFACFILSSTLALGKVGRVDAVWAANPNILSLVPSRLFAFLHGCPVLLNVDDLWPDELYDLGVPRRSMLGRVGELLARLAYSVADGITPISPAYVPTLEQKYDVDSAKIRVIPAGVDIELFRAPEREARSDDGQYLILYVGAFSLAYDFDQVFQAAEDLAQDSPVEFILQGAGELTPYLHTAVRNLDLPNVKVVEKIVDRAAVGRLLGEADALLLPLSGGSSIEKGLATKVYEYQAAGKPIICCSAGYPGRYVRETKSGIVVEPGNYKALARAIRKLHKEREVGLALGGAGQRWVEANMTFERIGGMLRGAIEEAMENSLLR